MKTIKKVFEPITINTLTLPNRMVVSAMLSAHNNTDGTITERFIRYLEEKAKGGWGLIISGDYLMKEGAGKHEGTAESQRFNLPNKLLEKPKAFMED